MQADQYSPHLATVMQLRIARKIAGLTQRELGKRAHVDPTIISGLERGVRRSASYRTMVRLARALNCEPEELFPVALADPTDRSVHGP